MVEVQNFENTKDGVSSDSVESMYWPESDYSRYKINHIGTVPKDRNRIGGGYVSSMVSKAANDDNPCKLDN